MLSYIHGLTRPEILMDVQQCARFWNNPHLLQECAVRYIAKYLASMSTYVDLPDIHWRLTTCSIVYRPNIEKGIKCYVDTDFYGRWDQADADNAKNIMSRMGYVILYLGFLVLWYSTLQTYITLGNT